MMCVSNNNNKNNNNTLINTLMHYIIQNQSASKRQTISTRINPKIKEDFYFTCRKLRLLVNGRSNVALEALMSWFCETYEDSPRIVQTTLVGKVEKPKRILSVAQRLEVKLVKTDLRNLLNGLEQKRGHPDFLEGKLREVLPKAIRTYDETRDKEILELLERTEKWVK